MHSGSSFSGLFRSSVSLWSNVFQLCLVFCSKCSVLLPFFRLSTFWSCFPPFLIGFISLTWSCQVDPLCNQPTLPLFAAAAFNLLTPPWIWFINLITSQFLHLCCLTLSSVWFKTVPLSVSFFLAQKLKELIFFATESGESQFYFLKLWLYLIRKIFLRHR